MIESKKTTPRTKTSKKIVFLLTQAGARITAFRLVKEPVIPGRPVCLKARPFKTRLERESLGSFKGYYVGAFRGSQGP